MTRGLKLGDLDGGYSETLLKIFPMMRDENQRWVIVTLATEER
jgi:hypothetical protein